MTDSAVTIVSTNQAKIAEIQAFLELTLTGASLDIQEIQSLDVEHVAREKGRAAFTALGRPVLVDDTGLSVETLGGLPGALVTWFLSALGPAGIVNLMRGQTNRNATAATAIAYADEHGVWTFLGQVSGTISEEPRGEQGFGFDEIFIPACCSRTYAEMNASEKTENSMRTVALKKLKRFLASRSP